MQGVRFPQIWFFLSPPPRPFGATKISQRQFTAPLLAVIGVHTQLLRICKLLEGMSKSRERKKRKSRKYNSKIYLFSLLHSFPVGRTGGMRSTDKKIEERKITALHSRNPFLSLPSPFQLCNCGVKMRFFGTRKRARELQIDGHTVARERKGGGSRKQTKKKSGNPWFRNCYAFSKCGKNTYGGKKYVRVEI